MLIAAKVARSLRSYIYVEWIVLVDIFFYKFVSCVGCACCGDEYPMFPLWIQLMFVC